MINSTVLIGRLTADPELKVTPQGDFVCNFRIAVNRSQTTADALAGKGRKADFFSVVAWRSSAEFVTKHFTKGKPIGVQGMLRSDEYTDKDGKKQYTVTIQADKLSFVDSKATVSEDGDGDKR